MFVRNNWYVAAWSHEVSHEPLGRRILGQNIVLVRLNDELTAIEDRCPHRGMPLSQGRIVEGTLQCAYHGLRFNAQGQCVKIPGQEKIPEAACVKSFLTKEQDGAVWIWMGEPRLAHVHEIPEFPLHSDPNWLWHGETVQFKANHLYIYDNLLDLTHVGYVHQHTIGGQEETHSTAETKIEQNGNTVTVTRKMLAVDAPPTYKAVVPFTNKVDRWQRVEFRPGLVIISVGANERTDGAKQPLSYSASSFQAITPETEERTHYFWSTGVDRGRFGEQDLAIKIDQVRKTFEEDLVVIEAQFKRIMDDPERPLLAIRSDAASIMARRILEQQLAAEVSASDEPATKVITSSVTEH